MITAGGWFDWALRDPGPAGSTNGGRNGGKGMIPHSAEGYFDSLRALHDFHWGRALAPPGQRASWGATNLKDGIFVQHYSVWEQTWTSGAPYPNNNFFAFENEGVQGEALTARQTDNIIHVGRDLMELQHWVPRRPVSPQDTSASLYEHCECVRWGASPTACPSHRIPWNIIVPALLEELDMPLTEQDKRDIADIVRLENQKQTTTLENWITFRFIALIGWMEDHLAPKP